MTLTPALTPYTCALACLESYFSDIGRPLSQCEMLKQHYQILENPDPAHKHEYGATSEAQIILLCNALRFTAVLYQDFRQTNVEQAFSDALGKRNGILISAFWEMKSFHCVRLNQIKNPGLYQVMCPSFHDAKFLDVTFPDLVKWGFKFIIIS